MGQKDELGHIRIEIDKIDEVIFDLLKKRFLLVKKVGEYKKKHALPIRNVEREEALLKKAISKSGMNREFVENFYDLLFKNSYLIEK